MIKNTNYEVPYHIIYLNLQLLPLSEVHIFSSATYSEIPLICMLGCYFMQNMLHLNECGEIKRTSVRGREVFKKITGGNNVNTTNTLQ
jgi:hypothetical protein